jgi:Co/Zn/Cd efflux system component
MHFLLPPSTHDQTLWRPTNRTLLTVAASSFLIFVIAEVVGALKSNSLSLLGDAIAMSVDVFTYFTNYCAEGTKQNYTYRSEYTRILTDVAVPSFSVACLLGVTGYIAYDAIIRLIRPPPVDDVPVIYMYVFSSLNLVIDLVCWFFFYLRGSDVFYEPIVPLNVPTISLDIGKYCSS